MAGRNRADHDELYEAGGVYRPRPRRVVPSAVLPAEHPAEKKVRFESRATRRRPLTMQGPILEIRLMPMGRTDWIERNSEASLKRAMSQLTPKCQALTVYSSVPQMSGFFDWLWDFIKAIVTAIYEAVKAIINLIIEGIKKVLQAVRWLIGQLLKLPALLLEFVEWFPLTKLLYLGLDYITGGALTSLKALLYLPGKFVAGEHISREEVLLALKIVGPIATLAVGFLTGGLALAAISAGAAILKNGPIGETAIGRLLLDIVSVGAGAMLAGSTLINAFTTAGKEVLVREGKELVADLTGVPVDVLDIVGGDVSKVASGEKVDLYATTKAISQSSLSPEPVKFLTGATYSVAEAAPGTELQALDKYNYSYLDDKTPAASMTYEAMKDPTKVADALASGAGAAASAVSDPGGALVAASEAVASGAVTTVKAIPDVVTAVPGGVAKAAEAVPSILSVQPPSLPTEIKVPTFPGMPDIQVDPKDAVDFILGLLSSKPGGQQIVTQVIEEYAPAPEVTGPTTVQLRSRTGMVKAAAGFIVGLTILGTLLMDSGKKKGLL